MILPKLIVFASGTKEGGGSGFENLVRYAREHQDAYEVVAVVSNHENGGVREKAERLGIPFMYMSAPFEAAQYRAIVDKSGAEWVALSGWVKKISGLDSAKTFNIHPALLSFDHGRFGGKGMWGHHVHEAVKRALDAGEITESGFSMHFVNDEYDRGRVFFEHRVPLSKNMSAEDIARAVGIAEHEWQPRITADLVHGRII
jgi:phosphoribosylglycinamide formyltransferase 1